MINNEFVPYEPALELKELGFDEPCFAVYSEFDKTRVYEEQFIVEGLKVPAPTFSQAFRFFRKKYFKMSYIYYDVEYKFCFCIGYNDKTKGFKTYEEAEFQCLKKLIEIVKK